MNIQDWWVSPPDPDPSTLQDAFEEEYTDWLTAKLWRLGHDLDAELYVEHRAVWYANEIFDRWSPLCTREELHPIFFEFAERDPFLDMHLVLNFSALSGVEDKILEKYEHRDTED